MWIEKWNTLSSPELLSTIPPLNIDRDWYNVIVRVQQLCKILNVQRIGRFSVNGVVDKCIPIFESLKYNHVLVNGDVVMTLPLNVVNSVLVHATNKDSSGEKVQ